MALQPLPSFSLTYVYDVFLSFRGSDTRYGFTGYLYQALHGRGIHTFIDDEHLQRGDEITAALVKAIQESRIAIIVLSNNYATSSFCLDELTTILDCALRKGLLVLPVFYGVDPSDLRHNKGSYGEALAKHDKKFKAKKESFNHNMERLAKWKMALHQVANLSGYHFKQGDGYESKFIGSIVEFVSSKINRTPLHVADYLVGLESRVLEVLELLDIGSDADAGVLMIGIHGIGGIGKSTLARAVYNLVAGNFDGLCYLENIREKSSKHDGLEHLQSILLSEVLGEKEIKLSSVPRGISMIKHRLQRKKVLLILDDVDTHQQLKAIVGKPEWFGPGSRVIITTRDKQLLESHGVKRTYKVKELHKNDALQLLTWNAFRTKEIDPSYWEVMNQVVTYASGLPLALEVIGSNLVGKSTEEWKSACNQCKRIPNSQILEILKVSFDGLEEEEKNVFFDIACCLKGDKLIEIEDILHAHYGHCMKYHVGVLVQKSLIKHGLDDTIKLHDLIEDMGKEIVRQESPKEPGKRSRLWLLEDIAEVLENNTETSETEIICLNFPKGIVEWNGKAFKEMKKLKTLIIRNGDFSKDAVYLPNNLRVLEWRGYPSYCLPPDFYDLSKKFVYLKVLNFDRCECLSQISIDVSSFPNLEKLSFANCKNLIKVDDSVGSLEKLKELNAFGCTKLRSLPPLKLTSLEELRLSSCSILDRFPEILEKMENIRKLRLHRTSINELPFSFQNLVGLRELTIVSDGGRILRLPSSIVMMPELTEFNGFVLGGLQWLNHEEVEEKVGSLVSSKIEVFSAPQNNLGDDFFSICFTRFAHVKELDLSKNNFTIIPECIKEFQFLWKLNVIDCKHLREIRGIPPSLKHFYAENCKSLARSSANIFLNKELHEAGNTFILLPTGRIPEWFDQHSRFPLISFWFRNKFPNKILCLIFAPVGYCYPKVFINGNERPWHGRILGKLPVYNHTYLFDLRAVGFPKSPYEEHFGNEWNHVQISLWGDSQIKFRTDFGIHIFEQGSSMEDVRFTCPYSERKLDNNLNRSQNPSKRNRFCVTCLDDWVEEIGPSIGPVYLYTQFGIIKELTSSRINNLMFSNKWEVNSSIIAQKNRLLQEIRRVEKDLETWVGGLVMRYGRATVMCDGAVSYTNQKAVCAAVIIRDGFGYLGGFAMDLEFMSAIEAELWGVFYGIRFAIAEGFSKLQIHSDSRQAVTMLQTGIFPPPLSHLGQRINSSAEKLQHVSYWHSGRDMNILAYLFAKHGLSIHNDVVTMLQPGIFPPPLSHLGQCINSSAENLQHVSYCHSGRDMNILAYLFATHGLSVDNNVYFFDPVHLSHAFIPILCWNGPSDNMFVDGFIGSICATATMYNFMDTFIEQGS